MSPKDPQLRLLHQVKTLSFGNLVTFYGLFLMVLVSFIEIIFKASLHLMLTISIASGTSLDLLAIISNSTLSQWNCRTHGIVRELIMCNW